MGRAWVWLALAAGVVAGLGYVALTRPRGRPLTMSAAEFEQYARRRFAAEHPGERPLNWAIGAAAQRFHAARPMGRFRLSLEPRKWGNDCSDFVECVIDEGLGVRARWKRGSQQHLVGTDRRYFREFRWDGASPLQPGDVVSVAHSPWYTPYEGANWHVGVVGEDGMVYDFVKLKSWTGPRYGRYDVKWFVRHSPGAGEVIVGRLRPEYRYRLQPITPGSGHV